MPSCHSLGLEVFEELSKVKLFGTIDRVEGETYDRLLEVVTDARRYWVGAFEGGSYDSEASFWRLGPCNIEVKISLVARVASIEAHDALTFQQPLVGSPSCEVRARVTDVENEWAFRCDAGSEHGAVLVEVEKPHGLSIGQFVYFRGELVAVDER